MGGRAPGVISRCAPTADGMGAQSMGPERGQLAGDVPEAEPQLCPRTTSPPAVCGSFIDTAFTLLRGSHFVLA